MWLVATWWTMLSRPVCRGLSRGGALEENGEVTLERWWEQIRENLVRCVSNSRLVPGDGRKPLKGLSR